MKTKEEKFEILEKMAFELNAAMPTDIALKGDGSLWVQMHGNDYASRKASQEEILKLVYAAKKLGDRMISV